MDRIIQRNRQFNQLENAKNGLLFGAIAGFWLALSIWGWDALLLSVNNSDLPWLKFVLGAPILIILTLITGWLTARFDHSALGALMWILVGIATVWLAGYVSFAGQSTAVGIFEPEFAGLNIYPIVNSISVRMRLLYVIVAVLFAIGGALEMSFVEAAGSAGNQLIRFLRLGFCLVIFVPAGIIVDNLLNADLRTPIIGTNQLIQFGLEVRKGGISKETQREMGIRAIRVFGDHILSAYRLKLGYYDPENLEETIVHVDFSGEWGSCSLIRGRPFVCRMSADRYLKPLACLVDSGSEADCHLMTTQNYGGLPSGIFSKLEAVPLRFGIIGQRGTAILAVIEDGSGDQVECVLRDSGDVMLERCRQAEKLNFDTLQLPLSATPKRTADAPAALSTLLPGVNDKPFDAESIGLEDFDTTILVGAPNYNLSLKISPDLLSFDGKAHILFTNQEVDQLEKLFFRLFPNGKGSYGDGSLEIKSILIEGTTAGFELSVSNTVLKVDLPKILNPGDKISIDMEYTGQIPKDFGGSATPAGYGIYNLSDGVLALSGWFPLLAVYDEHGWNLDHPSEIGDSVYSDTSFFSVELSIPDDLVVASTGVITAVNNSDDISLYQIDSGPARDFFITASTNFAHLESNVQGTRINVYIKPGDEKAGERALHVAARSLEIYTDKFGPYPYKELDIVAAPMRNALGVEFPGIVLIDQDLYEEPGKPEFEITIAHEVAHQWWYAVVGNDVFDDPWLDEALATYSSSLYYEYGPGIQYANGLRENWKQQYARLVNNGKDDLITASLAHFEALNDPSVYGGIVYLKGALFFQSLRDEIEDEAFFQGLQTYYRREAFNIARPDDLLDTFDSASGHQLDDFYRTWLFVQE